MEDPIKENNRKEKKIKGKERAKQEVSSSEIITREDFEYANRQWKYKTIAWICMFVMIAIVLSSSITYYITIGKKYSDLYNSASVSNSDETVEAGDSINDIVKVLNSFATVIDENYVGDINKSEIINSTLKGFVDGIGDKYSEYMTAEEWEKYQLSAMGNYSGIGAYMAENDDGNVVIASTIKNSPAEKAGIQSGDVIVGINGESTSEMSLEEVSSAAKGDDGTNVTINVERNGEYLDFDLTREVIKVYHVESEMLDEKTGYIELFTFDDNCAEEFESEMDNLVSQGATQVVFDLRYNTGGIVDEALKIADLFVEKGATELIEKDSKGNERVIKSQTDKKYDVKMVILINEYTASSSEILTGCLVDNGAAISTIGKTSYGKGVIQNVYSLSNGGVLKLTTAEYYTPNRNKINEIGITPEYEVELDDVSNFRTENDAQLQKAKEVLNAN